MAVLTGNHIDRQIQVRVVHHQRLTRQRPTPIAPQLLQSMLGGGQVVTVEDPDLVARQYRRRYPLHHRGHCRRSAPRRVSQRYRWQRPRRRRDGRLNGPCQVGWPPRRWPRARRRVHRPLGSRRVTPRRHCRQHRQRWRPRQGHLYRRHDRLSFPRGIPHPFCRHRRLYPLEFVVDRLDAHRNRLLHRLIGSPYRLA